MRNRISISSRLTILLKWKTFEQGKANKYIWNKKHMPPKVISFSLWINLAATHKRWWTYSKAQQERGFFHFQLPLRMLDCGWVGKQLYIYRPSLAIYKDFLIFLFHRKDNVYSRKCVALINWLIFFVQLQLWT